MEKICANCGKTFSKLATRAASQWERQRYCSLKCNGRRPKGVDLQNGLQAAFDDRYIPEPNSGCWIWMGAAWTSPSGLRGKMYSAHQRQRIASHVSYELHTGPIPAGLIICHKCDTPICVNPNHLYAGTHQDNSDDKMRRGRHRNQYTAA